MNILRFSKLLLSDTEIKKFHQSPDNIQNLNLEELQHIALDASLVASLFMIKTMNLSLKHLFPKNSSQQND